MRQLVPVLTLALTVFAQADQLTSIDVGAGNYVAGASRDNQTWFVKQDGGFGGGFWTTTGFQALQAPADSLGVFEAKRMSSNGQWIVGNAAYFVNDYVVYKPVLWNRQGEATVLTQDLTFDSAVAVSDNGQTVLLTAQSMGAGIWRNGVIEGKAWTNPSDMSSDGLSFSYGRDVGPFMMLGVESAWVNANFPTLKAEGGGMSGNGLHIFGRTTNDFGPPVNRVNLLGPDNWDTTEIGGAFDTANFGSAGFVSYDGLIAASETSFWAQGRQARRLTSLGLSSSLRITSVGQDDESIFIRDLSNGNDYILNLAAVPEPATFAGLALGAWFLRRRRK